MKKHWGKIVILIILAAIIYNCGIPLLHKAVRLMH